MVTSNANEVAEALAVIHDGELIPTDGRFTREVWIGPAYDCITNQPCQLPEIRPGAHSCTPANSHGRHACEMVFTLRSNVAELSVTFLTGWDLPETFPKSTDYSRVETRPWPRGAIVHFHSAIPHYDGQPPTRSDDPCPRWPGQVCYSDAGYTMADEPAEALLRRGSDAVWTWLENLHDTEWPGAHQ